MYIWFPWIELFLTASRTSWLRPKPSSVIAVNSSEVITEISDPSSVGTIMPPANSRVYFSMVVAVFLFLLSLWRCIISSAISFRDFDRFDPDSWLVIMISMVLLRSVDFVLFFMFSSAFFTLDPVFISLWVLLNSFESSPWPSERVFKTFSVVLKAAMEDAWYRQGTSCFSIFLVLFFCLYLG